MQLVRDRWYIILDADEVPRGRALGVTRLGVPLALWRDSQGVVRATSDVCPHRGASLSQGPVHGDDLACPFHGFRFRGDGACTAIPAQGTVPTGYGVHAYAAREAHGFVWLWWGDATAELPPIPWFDDLLAPRWRWRAGRLVDDWKIHWTRVVENQLDFIHLPYVHATSIGRFVLPETVVATESDGDRLRATVTNQPNTIIDFVAPNLWRNQLGKNGYGLAAFVPVDEGTTRTYIRYYQADVPWPVLSWLYGTVMGYANRWIFGQDRAVVTRQPQGPAYLGNGEKLIAADAPIIWFRRWLSDNGVGRP